ncbi:MAG: flagellar motor protein MotB, partial [Pedobacter sp.]
LHLLRQDSVSWNVTYPTFNTPKDEFSPIYFNRGLIFTSNRDLKWGITKTFGWNETPFTDLYLLSDTATITTTKPDNYFYDTTYLVATKAKIQQLPKTLNDNKVLGNITYPKTVAYLHLIGDSTNIELLDKELNTSLHDGPMSVSSDMKTIFYNRNNYRTSDEGKKNEGIYKLNMFSAKYVGGRWYDIKPFPYNSLEYSTAHPALTHDGNTLYFVSDMPGGFGGKDLYYSLKEGDSWSKPVNMGNLINTEGDESFPFVALDGTFYFSSTGHPGLGGLDLFKVILKDHAPASAIMNLGYPVNSSKDDFGFITDVKNSSGYFSSNRFGSDDIFKFNYAPIHIRLEGKIVTAYVGGSKIAVPNAKVQLTFGSKIVTVQSDNIGNYAFDLIINTDYKLQADKEGFTGPAIATVTTNGITRSTTLKKDLELFMPPVIAVVPPPAPKEDCATLSKELKVENIFYDLDKFFIRKDAIPAMTKLLEIMKAYPKVTVQVKSHTDSRASVKYNEVLSNNRAKAAINWLVERGISRSRFSAEYFGKRKLVNGCGDNVDCSEDKHQLNRRSEFYLFLNGKNMTIDCGL